MLETEETAKASAAAADLETVIALPFTLIVNETADAAVVVTLNEPLLSPVVAPSTARSYEAEAWPVITAPVSTILTLSYVAAAVFVLNYNFPADPSHVYDVPDTRSGYVASKRPVVSVVVAVAVIVLYVRATVAGAVNELKPAFESETYTVSAVASVTFT